MNLEDMSYFMATQGFTIMHFWDAMELHGLDTVEDAVKFLYNQKFNTN